MRKLFLMFLVVIMFVFSACSPNPVEEVEKEIVEEKVNTLPKEEIVPESEDILDQIKFNSNLEDFEEKWLDDLRNRNPNSGVYHIKTKEINCEDCYEVFYKIDREIVKIKVLDGEKEQETRIVDDLFTEIENEEVCILFSGNWNECPRLCPTDEEACATVCGMPTCELDQTLTEYRKLGEKCGAELGDCEFGFSCYFESNSDRYGICK